MDNKDEFELLKKILTDWHGEGFQSEESYSAELISLLIKYGVEL